MTTNVMVSLNAGAVIDGFISFGCVAIVILVIGLAVGIWADRQDDNANQ